MRHWLLFLLVCGIAAPAAAQPAADLPFYSPDTVQVQQLAAAHRAAVQRQFATPPAGSAEYRAHYRKIGQEAAAEVYSSVRYSALLDPVLNPYVQGVFRQIQEANPQLAAVRLVLSRNPEPNAHAVGTGTIMLNVGLLARLENESQLAFILCHELAHVQAQHMATGLREQLATIHSRETKREVHRIVAEEYNVSSRLRALALGLSLHSTYHQRRHEKQADSLGYVLLRRTSFDAAQAYRALQLLDGIDQPLSPERLDLARYFGCGAFPYPAGAPAPAKPRSIFTVAAPVQTVLETTDTLKSHPDCAKRMQYLRELAGSQMAAGPTAGPPAPAFARVRAVSRRAAVQSWFDYACYDHALFEALHLLREQPQDAYSRAVVVLSLYELRAHLLNHRFTEVVSNPAQHHADGFNQLLAALYGWQAADYPGLSACFGQATGPAPAPPAGEYALAAEYAAAALAGAPGAATLQRQYLAQYPNGKFTQLLFPTAPAKKSAR